MIRLVLVGLLLALASVASAAGFDGDDLPVIQALCGGAVQHCRPYADRSGEPPECTADAPASGADVPGCIVTSLCAQPIVVRQVFHGHFSAGDAPEAIVTFDDPCGSHATSWGGYARLRDEGGTWRTTALRENDGADLADCVRFEGALPARDFLVCGSIEEYGSGMDWRLSSVHFEDRKARQSELVHLRDNSIYLCESARAAAGTETAYGTFEIRNCQPTAHVCWFSPRRPRLRVTEQGRGLGVTLKVGTFLVPGEDDDAPWTADRSELERATLTLAFRNTGQDLELRAGETARAHLAAMGRCY